MNPSLQEPTSSCGVISTSLHRKPSFGPTLADLSFTKDYEVRAEGFGKKPLQIKLYITRPAENKGLLFGNKKVEGHT